MAVDSFVEEHFHSLVPWKRFLACASVGLKKVQIQAARSCYIKF